MDELNEKKTEENNSPVVDENAHTYHTFFTSNRSFIEINNFKI